MENTAHSIECDADARPPAFRNFRPIVQQQCFNVRPGNVGSLFEDGFPKATLIRTTAIVLGVGKYSVWPLKLRDYLRPH